MIRKRKKDPKQNYSIKKNYRIRAQNDDYFDGTSFDRDLIYQPDVYRLANYLASRSGAKYVIDVGAGNGEKLTKYVKNVEIIAIDCDVNIKELKENLSTDTNHQHKVIEYDLEKGLPEIDESVLKQSIVISSDVIEHVVNLEGYLTGLSRYSNIAPFVLISTPDRDRARGFYDYGPPANIAHVREWTAGELNTLLDEYSFSNIRTGYTINTNQHKDKTTILSISGTHNMSNTTPLGQEYPSKKTLAIVTVFNEEDIIEYSIRNLLDQGVDIYVLDNWSTDRTQEKLKKLQEEYEDRVTIEVFPKAKPKKYEWKRILDRVDLIASESNYDWIIHHDADEIRKSPHPAVSLSEAISVIDYMGYDAIDHTVVDFRPTENGYDEEKNPEEFFRYYEFGSRPGHFVQIKAWKNKNKSVHLSDSGGHAAQNESQKVYPLKFLIKHYPLRSEKQARKKIFSERLPRIKSSEKKKGWHIQYDSFNQKSGFIWDRKVLKKFHNVMFWQEEFVEQISGIGIIDQENKTKSDK